MRRDLKGADSREARLIAKAMAKRAWPTLEERMAVFGRNPQPSSRTDEPTRRPAPGDLRAWAELLARHHRSLRRPLATGRPLDKAAVDA